jgi:hypothetical protein
VRAEPLPARQRAVTRRLYLAGVDEAEIDAYAARRADYVADVLRKPNVFWLARAQCNPLGFDWRRGVCPECQRPAELPDPERPCSACRVDELLRVRAIALAATEPQETRR